MDSSFIYISITKKALLIYLGLFRLFLFVIVGFKVPLTLKSSVFAFLLLIDKKYIFLTKSRFMMHVLCQLKEIQYLPLFVDLSLEYGD